MHLQAAGDDGALFVKHTADQGLILMVQRNASCNCACIDRITVPERGESCEYSEVPEAS